MSSRNLGETARVEDAALTLAAQAGDVASLGLLLERHRAGMRAVAVSVLGPGPDVDDVVKDGTAGLLHPPRFRTAAPPHIRDLSTSTSHPGANGSNPCSLSQRMISRLRNDHHARIASRSTSVP